MTVGGRCCSPALWNQERWGSGAEGDIWTSGEGQGGKGKGGSIEFSNGVLILPVLRVTSHGFGGGTSEGGRETADGSCNGVDDEVGY